MDDIVLDLSGLKCPLPVLRTRKALAGMSAGTRLEIHCTDPMAAIDIPHLVRENGDLLELQHAEQGRLTFVIVKGAPR